MNKELICFKEWKNKHLFKINVYKEFINENKNFKDLVFIEFYENFKNKISMKLNLNELRDFKNAAKELFDTGSVEYKKYTNSTKSQHSNDQKINSLTITKQEDKNNYFINYSDGTKSVSMGFNRIQFLSFIESLNLFCNYAEEKFYI